MTDRSNLARANTPARAAGAPAPRRPSPRPQRAVAPRPKAKPKADKFWLEVFMLALLIINLAGFWPQTKVSVQFAGIVPKVELYFPAAGYYLLDRADRVYSPLHDFLKPSGVVGQGAGVLALLIFIFLWLYPLRKKYRRLAWTGNLQKWLDVHILTALGMPLLLTIHAAWHLTNTLIGLGFWSMMIVVASGIVGRYLYERIPRDQAGVALSKEQVVQRRQAILAEIAEALGQDVATVEQTLDLGVASTDKLSLWAAFNQLLLDDFHRWRMSRKLRRRWQAMLRSSSFSFRVQRQKRIKSERAALDKAVSLANREMALDQQAKMLDATNGVFQWWHVAHRPFAVTAGVAVIIHVVVVVIVGQTWFH